MIQLIEVALASATCIVGMSLWFANTILKRDAASDVSADPLTVRRALIAEKRRVIERERSEWLKSPQANPGRNETITQCNEQLLALADEEAKLVQEDS